LTLVRNHFEKAKKVLVKAPKKGKK
jgi:hypothetical protein